MKRKLMKTAALLLTLALAFSLAACGKKEEVAEAPAEGEANKLYSTAGGEISVPETLVISDTANTLTGQVSGDKYVGGVTLTPYRSTGYILVAGDSLTVNTNFYLTDRNGESVKTKYTDVSVSLWQKQDGGTSYVQTAHFKADGTNQTYTFTGLQGGGEYRIGFTYSTVASYRLNGTFSIGPVTAAGGEEETVAKE